MDRHEAVIYQFPVTTKDATALVETGATEETGAQQVALESEEKSKSGGRAYLVAGRQNFTEDYFKNPQVAPKIARFLIAEIERLDDDCGALKILGAKYNDMCVQVARLEESGKKSGLIDVLSVLCLGAGSAGLGAAPSYLAIANLHGVGWTFAIGSGVLLAGGLISPIASFISRVRK